MHSPARLRSTRVTVGRERPSVPITPGEPDGDIVGKIAVGYEDGRPL